MKNLFSFRTAIALWAIGSALWVGAAVHTVLTKPATVYTLTIPAR